MTAPLMKNIESINICSIQKIKQESESPAISTVKLQLLQTRISPFERLSSMNSSRSCIISSGTLKSFNFKVPIKRDLNLSNCTINSLPAPPPVVSPTCKTWNSAQSQLVQMLHLLQHVRLVIQQNHSLFRFCTSTPSPRSLGARQI